MINKSKSRIDILDSYRSLAIIAVLLFHFFSRNTTPYNKINLYTYNNQYNYFGYGYLGVEFFFIISDFVIFFILEHINAFTSFLENR